MKRIALTGATGMIGVSLVEEALRRGIGVVALVRPGSPRLSALPRDARLTVVPCGLDGLAALEAPARCEAFFHLGWDKTFGGGRDDAAAQAANIGFTLDAVSLAARMGCAAFVGAGSQAEYGPAQVPLSPDLPVAPESGYGVAKFAAGRLAKLACERLGLRCGWARILSVYGEGDAPHTLVSYVVRTLLEGGRPALSPCGQVWDYLYRADAARGLLAIAESGVHGRTYPLGSGAGRPLRAYVEQIRDAIDPALPLGFGEREYYPHQPMLLQADLSQLTADTGFTPETPFAEGIQKTIEWCRTHDA